MQEFIEQSQRLEQALAMALEQAKGDEALAIDLLMLNASGTLSFWSEANWRKVMKRYQDNLDRREFEGAEVM